MDKVELIRKLALKMQNFDARVRGSQELRLYDSKPY